MRNQIIIGLLFFSSFILAQNEEKTLQKAKENYELKQFANAERNYRIVSGKNSDYNAVSQYNMGNSVYKMNQYDEALYVYFKATELAKTKEEKHKAFHNLGNVLMKEKEKLNCHYQKWQEV